MVKRRKMGTAGGNQKSELQRETPILHSNSEWLHLTAREVERLLEAAKGARNDAPERLIHAAYCGVVGVAGTARLKITADHL